MSCAGLTGVHCSLTILTTDNHHSTAIPMLLLLPLAVVAAAAAAAGVRGVAVSVSAAFLYYSVSELIL